MKLIQPTTRSWSIAGSDIDGMDGEEFEACLVELFAAQGLKVSRTPKFGDFGVDLVVEVGTDRMAVQAKRYHKKVGVRAVQEIVAGRVHYECDSARVMTNHYFTPEAEHLAESCGVELWSRDELAADLLAAGLLDPARPKVVPKCWQCDVAMVSRDGRYGSFYGCRNYPKCHCTVPLDADRPLWFRPRTAAVFPGASWLSPDGHYWWDGAAWISSLVAAPPWAFRSEDGHFWWDGIRWRPLSS